MYLDILDGLWDVLLHQNVLQTLVNHILHQTAVICKVPRTRECVFESERGREGGRERDLRSKQKHALDRRGKKSEIPNEK